MSWICNTVLFLPGDDFQKALFGRDVERHIARGSAFFCGGASELFRLMAATELLQFQDQTKYIATAAAYLEASVDEYEKALQKSRGQTFEHNTGNSIAQLNYDELYVRSLHKNILPDMPAAWGKIKATARAESPDQLLGVFRDQLVECLHKVRNVQASLNKTSNLETNAIWEIGTQLMQSWTAGQAIAIVYQTTTEDSTEAMGSLS